MSAQSLIPLEDYDVIAAAVMETERGRWFLAEFARRNRMADTTAVLDALAAVESRLSARSQPEPNEAAKLAAAAVAERAAGLRDCLLAAPKPGRTVSRALVRSEALERAVGQLLAALDVAPPAPSPVRIAAPSAEAGEARDPADEPDQDFNWIDLEDFEGAIAGGPAADGPAADIHASKTRVSDEAEPLPDSVSPQSSPVDEDLPDTPPVRRPAEAREPEEAVISASERCAAPDGAASHAPAPAFAFNGAPFAVPEPARRAGPPKLPTAWTPGLLESLSDEDKAILFA